MSTVQIVATLEELHAQLSELYKANPAPNYATALGSIQKAAGQLDIHAGVRLRMNSTANVFQTNANNPDRFKGKPPMAYGSRNVKKKGVAVAKPVQPTKPEPVPVKQQKEEDTTPIQTIEYLRGILQGKAAKDVTNKYSAEQIKEICKEIGVKTGKSRAALPLAKRLLSFLFESDAASQPEEDTKEDTEEDAGN